MINQDVSIFIALVHNNNIRRNIAIRPRLENLLQGLEPHFTVEKIEVSFQPEIKPHSTVMAFIRDVMYRNLDREWHRYRLLKPLNLLRDILGFIKGSFIKYIVERDSTGKSWKRSSAIEVLVTEKHLRAWGGFLDSGADFLLCFEDDAVFKDDSVQRIKGLIGLLSRGSLDAPIYVDLAGGCGLNELKIDNLETGYEDSFRFFRKPVTNTACVYLMSRTLVAHFHATLARRPWLRLIGADWLMNSLFIRLANDGIECVCMHAEPTVFKHGTAMGDYVSTIR